MKQFLLSATISIATVLIGLVTAADAAVIADFGVDPTSAAGAFSNHPGLGAFNDEYTFSLDHQMSLTIVSVTNVFARKSDFITGFTGEVVSGTPSMPGSILIGPVAASACIVPLCQGFAGSAILGPGKYFLDIFGKAGRTAGYGGNLATFGVTPLPAALPLFLGGLGLLGFGTWRRKSTD